MQFGYFAMPSHPPERGLKDGHDWDLQVLRWADELGFKEAWIGEHYTSIWEPHPSPDLRHQFARQRSFHPSPPSGRSQMCGRGETRGATALRRQHGPATSFTCHSHAAAQGRHSRPRSRKSEGYASGPGGAEW